MIGLIVAISPNNIIGLNGTIPWDYPLDLKRFSHVTRDSTIIMGRKTWESIGRPLKGRRNIVITSKDVKMPAEGGNRPDTFKSIEDALDACSEDENIWFIGGKRIYEDAFKLGIIDIIDVTYVPDRISVAHSESAYLHLNQWLQTYVRDFSVKHPDPRLSCVRYHRMGSIDAQITMKNYHASLDCRGERCSVCGIDATHKLEASHMSDDPLTTRVPLSAYVCCKHYRMVLGPATGCPSDV